MSIRKISADQPNRPQCERKIPKCKSRSGDFKFDYKVFGA